ncbi:MAG: autotransporter assembly complex family protein [Gallionella sp.]|nr:autotransporter assembly complex family protein [Gallionella sp.]
MKPSALTVLASLCSLALLLLSQPVFASEGQQLATYDIELQIPPEQRSLMQEHLDLYRWRGSERMDEAQLQRLVRLAPEQIRAFLATEGFYAPLIAAKMTGKSGKYRVKLTIEPGEPVRVTSIDLQVTGAFNDDSAENRARLNKMRSDWSLRPGAVFRHDNWESAKRNALKSLLLDRYPTASITDSRALVHPQTNSVELQATLDSGPGFTFGELKIQGLDRYPATLVERMNPITPGEPYSQIKLLNFQSRLQDSPYFERADVSINTAQPSRVPVQVDLVENKSQKLGLGIGMSTDTGPRILLDHRDLNFLDRAWGLGSTLKLDQKQQTLSSNLQLPANAQGYRDNLNAQMERTDISGEVTQKLIMGAKRAFVHDKTESAFGINYFIETQHVQGSISARNSTLSPFYSWTLRNVDDLLYPSSGYLLNFKTDVAARSLLSDQDFLRGHGRAVYFYPVGTRDQFILHGELGIVAARSRNGIPSDLLFRTGGDQTVRGYAYQSLGVPQGQGVVGGRYLALASAEYVHWLTPAWGAAIFIDGGNAADTLGSLKPVYGYGSGARWKSPVGPLNLDLAYGQLEQKLRLHFSVGFNF